ncbi:MAG TPA: hypothetical protein VMB84_15925 [Stellaceae bacterium]|nr:hypothetical protein [Stellaceae bacterium]
MRRRRDLWLLIGAGLALGGCDVSRRVADAISPDVASLADRCAAITRLAMPAGYLEITQRSSENAGVTALVAHVEGVRSDLPAGAAERDIATECRFTNTTLTEFRWLKGGPPAPPTPPAIGTP